MYFPEGSQCSFLTNHIKVSPKGSKPKDLIVPRSAGPPATLADGWDPPVIAFLPPRPPPARALAPPPPLNPPHPAFPARLNEGGITPRVSLSRFPLFSLSLSLGFVRIHPAKFAGVFNGARDLRARFPLSPAALSPSRCYIFDPRASLFRFRRSPLALAVGFVPAPCSSLSAVAADLRFAADVAPVLRPTRRHLLRLRRVVADPVRRSASPADCRSTVALGIPNRAVAFLRSGSPPPSLRSSSRLGATSLGIAASPSTSSAPSFRSPTVGAPPSSSSRAAPPPSSAPAAVLVVVVVPG
uniref:HGWP repeat containing protein-like n=1 Tax=Oryza sativa subsp. japonica TaxID=39947 RepID=Q5VMV7_ORYSJ|nr:HGWP repeat containing protein-like [Oryza sativa Japonica Group]